MGLGMAKMEAFVSTEISPQFSTSINTGGFIMLMNNLVIFLALTVAFLAYMFRKECCKHIVTLAALIAMIFGSLVFFSSEYQSHQQATVRELPSPVYDFYNQRHKMYTFHFLPAEDREEQRNVQFYAFKTKQPGTEPVYQYWNYKLDKETFHFAPAWDAESKESIAFYAYREQQKGTEAVYDWTSKKGEHTVHFQPAWGKETEGGVQFYAYRTESAATLAKEAATGISLAVPMTAFLLGIAASTLWVAFLKWYRIGKVVEDEAQTGSATTPSGGVSAATLPSLLASLGLAGASSPPADEEAGLFGNGDDGAKMQLLIKTQEVTLVSRDTPVLEPEVLAPSAGSDGQAASKNSTWGPLVRST